MIEAPRAAVAEAVSRALAEDLLPLGDLTASLIPDGTHAKATFSAREAGVVAGRACVIETYAQLDPAVTTTWSLVDGDGFEAGAHLATMEGPLASILTGERTALNFLRHLCGVATLTRRFVELAPGTRILDTRKTTPGLRALEKAAVRAGGGFNHRANLSDAIMVKDNHLAGLSIAEAVVAAKAAWPGRPVHVECDTLEQLDEILATRADRAMVDNFTPAQVRAAVTKVGHRMELEVTGGVTLETVAGYAEAGPDFISVGAITHSAGVIDIGLDLSCS